MQADTSPRSLQSFGPMPRWVTTAACWATAAVIGWTDYVTSSEVSLFALYAIPIFMAVWFGTWRNGLWMATACTAIWWIANRADSPFTTWWGYHVAAASRFALFIVVAVAAGLMKSKQEGDRTRLEAMERTRELEQEIVRVSETEQRRIGQDLHDGLCQHLAAIGFAAKSLADDLEESARPEFSAAKEIEALLKQAVIETRDLARGMFPVQMDGAGLSAALEGLAATTSRLTSTKVVFTEVGQVHISDVATAMHLYRIAQESVANAVKHGAATRVFITLESVGEVVRLRIDDNGKGYFQQDDVGGGGMGMRTMAYRARLIGGTLEIQERDGPGTCVWCELGLSVPPNGTP